MYSFLDGYLYGRSRTGDSGVQTRSPIFDIPFCESALSLYRFQAHHTASKTHLLILSVKKRDLPFFPASNGWGRNILPGRRFPQFRYLHYLTGLGVYINRFNRYPNRIKRQ